eukprot:ctg_597.g297
MDVQVGPLQCGDHVTIFRVSALGAGGVGHLGQLDGAFELQLGAAAADLSLRSAMRQQQCETKAGRRSMRLQGVAGSQFDLQRAVAGGAIEGDGNGHAHVVDDVLLDEAQLAAIDGQLATQQPVAARRAPDKVATAQIVVDADLV